MFLARCGFTYLFVKLILSLEQPIAQDLLKFFHKNILRVKEADKRANNV